MENLFGLTLQEIEARCHELQIPAYRSKQIADWIYNKSANSFEEMISLEMIMPFSVRSKDIV